jgi:hypothetical protein
MYSGLTPSGDSISWHTVSKDNAFDLQSFAKKPYDKSTSASKQMGPVSGRPHMVLFHSFCTRKLAHVYVGHCPAAKTALQPRLLEIVRRHPRAGKLTAVRQLSMIAPSGLLSCAVLSDGFKWTAVQRIRSRKRLKVTQKSAGGRPSLALGSVVFTLLSVTFAMELTDFSSQPQRESENSLTAVEWSCRACSGDYFMHQGAEQH